MMILVLQKFGVKVEIPVSSAIEARAKALEMKADGFSAVDVYFRD